MGEFTAACLIPAVCTVTAVFLCVDLGLVESKRIGPRMVGIALVALICVVAALVQASYGVLLLRHLYPFIVVVPLFALASAYHRIGFSRSLFTFVYIVALVHLIFAVVDIVGAFIPLMPPAALLAVAVVVAAAICTLTHRFTHGIYQDVQDYMPTGWALGCTLASILAAAMLLLSFFAYAFDMRVLALVELALVIFTLLLVHVMLRLFKTISTNNRTRHETEMARTLRAAQRRVDEIQQHNEAEERRRRHDLRHTIQVIIDEVEAGDVESAVDHLVQLRGDTMVKATLNYCDNTAVNSVIRLWATRAGEDGIDMTVRADVPEGLSVDDMELATLFANLLENAYEACMRLERTENRRYIDIKCTYRQGKLIFAMENSCRSDVRIIDGMPVSQKRGGGIGTRSARSTVEQHGGMIRYEAGDGVFTTRFVMAA